MWHHAAVWGTPTACRARGFVQEILPPQKRSLLGVTLAEAHPTPPPCPRGGRGDRGPGSCEVGVGRNVMEDGMKIGLVKSAIAGLVVVGLAGASLAAAPGAA